MRLLVVLVMRRLFIAQISILALFLGFVALGVVFPERLGAFSLAFLCGAVGGSLSLLKRARGSNLYALRELASSWITTLMPLLYGSILASITYLFFLGCLLTGDGQGGMVTSNLFPRFAGLECLGPPGTGSLDMKTFVEIKPASIQDFAKILVWSVLAGYSETFVHKLLSTLEGRGP